MILLILMAAIPPRESADWFRLLETSFSWECSASWLTAGDAPGTLTEDGLPLPVTGSLPSGLPWPGCTVTDPLSSGIWGGGQWNLSVNDGTPRDSQSVSRTGLIQNTGKRGRYVFQLERPLPGGSWADMGMFRNDTVYLHSVTAGASNLDFRLAGWEGMGYGWGAWSGWKPAGAVVRAGYSRLFSGDRRPELLAQYSVAIPAGRVTAGAAAAGADSTVETVYAAGIVSGSGPLSITLSADSRTGDFGWWGGVGWKNGGLRLFASHSSPAAGESFQSAGVGYGQANMIARISHLPSIAADFSFHRGFVRGTAAAARYFHNDSLHIRGYALAGRDWYRGRIEAGPRLVSAMDGNGGWKTILDGVMGFTLGPFSFAVGLEDMLQASSRSWSFGITWEFIDEPPKPPEEGERGG